MLLGSLCTSCLGRLDGSVATQFRGSGDPAPDQTPRFGNTPPTNREFSSQPDLRPTNPYGSASALRPDWLRFDVAFPRFASDSQYRCLFHTTSRSFPFRHAAGW